MKKFIYIFLSLAVVIGILIVCMKNTDNNSDRVAPDSFVLIDGTPYITSEGNAYYFSSENEWILYETESSLKKLFRGDYFCALTDTGTILFETGISPEEYAAFPLGSAHTFSMAEHLSALSLEKPVLTLNQSPAYENCRALCEDGTLLLNSDEDYFSLTLPNETIKDISGEFVLTENGSVYQIQTSGSQSPSFKKVSDGPIVLISSCETAARCVGICEDGTAVMWSDLKPLDLSEWQDVVEVTMGFNYCAGLTAQGKILYADYNANRKVPVTDLLKQMTAEHITCSYQTLALLNSDGTVEIIDLDEPASD